MTIRKKIEDKIKRKEQEISEYEIKIAEGRAYLQGLQEALKILPREGSDTHQTETLLRPGSTVHKTYELLKKHGKPLHVTSILEGIGKGTSKKERTSLSGSLGWYVRRNEIFSRPSPNTFSLIEIGTNNATIKPPKDFGLDDSDAHNDDYGME